MKKLNEDRMRVALQDSTCNVIFLKSIDEKITLLVTTQHIHGVELFEATVVNSTLCDIKYKFHYWGDMRISVGSEYKFNYSDFKFVKSELTIKNIYEEENVYSRVNYFSIKKRTKADIRNEKLESIGII